VLGLWLIICAEMPLCISTHSHKAPHDRRKPCSARAAVAPRQHLGMRDTRLGQHLNTDAIDQ
jgi:hypothetical protein